MSHLTFPNLCEHFVYLPIQFLLHLSLHILHIFALLVQKFDNAFLVVMRVLFLQLQSEVLLFEDVLEQLMFLLQHQLDQVIHLLYLGHSFLVLRYNIHEELSEWDLLNKKRPAELVF